MPLGVFWHSNCSSVCCIFSRRLQALRATGWLMLVACATATSQFHDDRKWFVKFGVSQLEPCAIIIRGHHLCAKQISLTSIVLHCPMLKSCPSCRPVFAELEAGYHQRPGKLLVWLVRQSVFTSSVIQWGAVHFWTGYVLRYSWPCHWNVSQPHY